MSVSDYTIEIKEEVTLIALHAAPSGLGAVADVFDDMAAAGVNIDMISQSPPQGSDAGLFFTIADRDLDKALEVIARLRKGAPGLKSAVSSGNQKLLVCGEAMRTRPGVAATVFRAAAAAQADVRLVTTSEVDISLLISQPDAREVADSIRDALK